MQNSKSPGLDQFNVRLLKLAWPFISICLAHICNQSLGDSTFPDEWKKTKVTPILRVRTVAKKTYEIFHVYCIFYSGFICQTTVIFGITKDGSLVLNTLASWNCLTCRNLFQNGANGMSECLTCETAFCKKAQNFV